MTATSIESALVIGGGSGVGRATVLALASAGARVRVVGRHAAPLERVRQDAGGEAVSVSALDATDGPAMDGLIREVDPDLVVVSAGARARLGLVHEQTWESFSEPWNTDVKMSFQIGQSALRKPLRPGSRVILVSSGAGLGGSPLSGGYAGAKRTQMFLAGYLQRSADLAKLGIRFAAVVPKQLLIGTELGTKAADAYAAMAGVTRDKYMERFPVPLGADGVAQAIVKIAQGEVAREGTIIGVSGAGIEVL
jgi:NAD(P)-dependent dehydrogenase (short-subunit alcohol dehydrogenase family)